MELVKTINGESIDISKTRSFSGQFYKIGDSTKEGSGDCYLIDGKYYRDTDYIVYDHRIKRYVINNATRICRGIIGFNGKEPILGNFSVCPVLGNDDAKVNYGGTNFRIVDENIVKNNPYYRLMISNGRYYLYDEMPVQDFLMTKKVNPELKHRFPYDSMNVMDQHISDYEETNFKQYDRFITSFAQGIGKYSFGLEFETSRGIIPKRFCKTNGILPLRDGSIPGLEYVTIPYKGLKGLQALSNTVDFLNEFAEYDESCSLHVHIGNIPRTEKFILSLFRVMVLLQDDIYGLFPIYKKYNFRYKSKHYTAPLPIEIFGALDNRITDSNITKNFNRLFTYLSGGVPYSEYDNDLDNVVSHPRDRESARKWEVRTRYKLFNMIPLIFTNKETVEFRIHTPTFDKAKIFLFLQMCVSIIRFAERYENKILKEFDYMSSDINLLYVISVDSRMNKSVQNQLINYIHNRKGFFYNRHAEGMNFTKESEFTYVSTICGDSNPKLAIPKRASDNRSSHHRSSERRSPRLNYEGLVDSSVTNSQTSTSQRFFSSETAANRLRQVMESMPSDSPIIRWSDNYDDE